MSNTDPLKKIPSINQPKVLEPKEQYFQYGEMYEKGISVAVDIRKAIEWYTKAAVLNHIDAQYILGQIYESEFDFTSSFFWIKQAAQNHHKHAEVLLARCYLLGFGVNRSKEKSIAILTECGERGNAYAKFHLARYYLSGKYQKKDIKRAREILGSVVNVCNDKSYLLLLCDFEDALQTKNMPAIPSIIPKFETFTNCGSLISREAMGMLALIYEKGYGVAANFKTAFDWYQKASNISNGSILDFGYYCEQGLGCPKDLAKAAVIYKSDVDEKSELPAACRLVIYYALKKIVPESKEYATKLFNIIVSAAKHQNEDARIALAFCYIKGWGCKKRIIRKLIKY